MDDDFRAAVVIPGTRLETELSGLEHQPDGPSQECNGGTGEYESAPALSPEAGDKGPIADSRNAVGAAMTNNSPTKRS